jgi:hypothetical protein
VKLLQVDDLGAFDIESLQLLRGEGNELAELIFVSFDDLFPLDLLAGAGS